MSPATRLSVAAPLAAVLLLVTAFGAAARTRRIPASELVVAHVNDLHGYVFPRRYGGLALPASYQGRELGGLFSAATYLRGLRRGRIEPPGVRPGRRGSAPPVLFLDAGDWFGGTLHGAHTSGQAVAEVLLDPALDLDLTTFGNHAWDYGSEALLAFLRRLEGRVPVVCANVRYRGKWPPATEPYRVLERGGRRIAVLGLLTERSRRAAEEEDAGWEVTGEEEALRRYLPELNECADYVILLAHVGFTQKRSKRDWLEELDDEAPELNADLVIDGHSHVDEGLFLDEDTYLTQADHYGLRLGVVRVPFGSDGEPGHPESTRVVLDASRLRPSAAMRRRLGEELRARERLEGEVVVPAEPGVGIPHILRTNHDELVSRMGDLSCQAYLWAARREGHEPDVAIAYHRGVRAGLYSLGEGGITAGGIHALSPFGRPLAVIRVTGRGLRRVMSRGITSRNRMSFGNAFLVARDLPGKWERRELDEATVAGKPLEDDGSYLVATSEFMAGWFDDEGGEPELLELTPGEAVRDFLNHEAGGERLTQADVERLSPPSARLVR